MANKEFKIQSDTVSLNGVPLSSSADGKVVLPGVTRATGYQVDEVKQVGNEEPWSNVPAFVIDAVTYNDWNDLGSSNGRATYSVELDDDELDIEVVGGGAYSDRVAENNNMYAYVGQEVDPFAAFVGSDWVQIPYRPKMKASSIESELEGGGNSDIGDITFNDTTISAPDETEIVVEVKNSDSVANAKVVLNPEYATVKLESSFPDNTSFYSGNGYWSTAIWTVTQYGYGEIVFTGAQGLYNFLNSPSSGWSSGQNNRFSWNDGSLREFGGWSASGIGDEIRFTLSQAPVDLPPIDPTEVTVINFVWDNVSRIAVDSGDNQELQIQGNGMNVELGSSRDVNINAGDDLRLESNDILRLTNNSPEESVEIQTNADANTFTWAFNPDGSLTFPNSMTIETTYGGSPTFVIDGKTNTVEIRADTTILIGYNNSSGNVYIGNPNGGGQVDIVGSKFRVMVDAPTSSTGNVGDQAGQVAFDGSYIYYCTQSFGGTTHNVVHMLAQGFDANGVDNGYLVADTYQLPQVGWKVYYNGEVRTIDQVNSSNPGFYVVFVDSPLTIPGQALFAWGPAPATNIWKRIAWSGDTW